MPPREARDFLLHPVFLDCSTIVPLFPLRDRLDQASLFIPFAIEEFQAVALTGLHDVRVLVEPMDAGLGGRELLRYSFGIFDRQGHQLAAFRHFTVKKVRSLQNIRGLLEKSLNLRATACGHTAGGWTRPSRPPATPSATSSAASSPATATSPGIPMMPASRFSTSASIRSRYSTRPRRLRNSSACASTPPHSSRTPTSPLSPGICERRFPMRAPSTTRVARRSPLLRRQTVDPILELISELARPHLAGPWKQEHATTSFFELGLDSLVLLDLAEALEKRLAVRLYPTVLFEQPNAAALAAYLRKEFSDECARYAGSLSVAPTVTTVAPVDSSSDRRPEILVPRWLPACSDLAPSPAQAIALLTTTVDAGLCERLEANLGSRVCFRGGVAEFSAALADGLTCDEVCLVGVDHDFAFGVIKALIESGRLRAPLSLRAITLDCFRVHDESPRATAAHGVWGLLQSLSREYPQVSVSQFDLSTS